MKAMRAISLWQPWASLWLTAAKVHETRHWPTLYRGWLVVHAAKRAIDGDTGDSGLEGICCRFFGPDWRATLPRGALLGTVDIVDCVRTEKILRKYRETDDLLCDDLVCGDFSEGRYGWRRGRFRVFDAPVPYRGQQGIFNLPDPLFTE
jgi:activating signal cointegrator 1